MGANNMHILLVEDDLILRRLLAVQLRQLGYHVHEAFHGEEAWEMLQQLPISLVITDWLMPELDGIGLINRIRAHHLHRYIYVILLTSLDSENDLVAGIEAGADDYLTKPVRVRELAARMGIGKRIVALEAQFRTASMQLQSQHTNAEYDTMTLLLNRSTITHHLEQEIIRYQLSQQPFSIALLDVDGFGAINQRYGRDVGDSTIVWLAKQMRTVLRHSDSIGRWGTDEFLIVMPSTTAATAQQALTRLCAYVAKMPLRLEDGQSVEVEFSAGITAASLAATDSNLLLYQANEALRHAKNQVGTAYAIFTSNPEPEYP